jgi:hypothetical protein
VATATAIASGRDPGGHIGSHLETLRKSIGVSLQGFQRVQIVKVSEHEDHGEHKSNNEVQPLQYLTKGNVLFPRKKQKEMTGTWLGFAT